MYPVYYDLPYTSPSISVIVPYKEGTIFNPIHVCKNDEVIVITGGECIGEARITGAKKSINKWIVHTHEFVRLNKEELRAKGSERKYFIEKFIKADKN